jgi:dynein heavy chain 1
LLGGLQWSGNVCTCFRTQVKFNEPVSTVDHPKINEWLSLVEGQMRLTLASSLAQAVQDIKQFKDGAIDRQAYMHWCDKYQVGFLHF